MSRLRGDRAYWDRLGRPSARRVLGVWGGRGMEGRRRVPRVLPALLSRLSHSLLGQLSSSSSEDRPETREKYGVSVVFIFLSEDNPEIRLIHGVNSVS